MLIDSNLLIYSLNNASPKQSSAQYFLQQNVKELCIAQQNIFETLRIITHSKFPHPFSIGYAVKAVEKITQTAKLISPTHETPAIAFELIKKYNIQGTEVFDAYLVATALSHNISQIATDNVKHLGKYQEIRVISPFTTTN